MSYLDRVFETSSEVITIPNKVVFSGEVDLSSATLTGLTLTASVAAPDADDGAALGSTALKWSDLFLASGAVINFNNGDVTVTHSANTLTFAGASSGYLFDAVVKPATTDGAALGSSSVMWSDLFLASGAVINFNNGDVTITHSSNTLTIAGGDLVLPTITISTGIVPDANDGAYLGQSGTAFSDLFLASGAVINFDASDVTITHSANTLAFAGASSGYSFDAVVQPAVTDGAALGSTALMWSDLFLASGGIINFNNGDINFTHGANILTFSGGVLSVGTFASAIAGSGVALGTLTKAFDVLADDGVAALTAGSYQATRSRMLIASEITTGDISVGGLTGQLKIAANVASSGYLCGVRGYVECASASISSAAGVRGMIDVPSGSTIASGTVAAAFQASSNDLGGTHTGKAAVLHVPNPVAGTWDVFVAFGSAPGGIVANTHAIDSHSLSYIISVLDPAGSVGYIPVLAEVPS